jgi:ubiquinone/menaquinone biosynthesis C-methylase UbiE
VFEVVWRKQPPTNVGRRRLSGGRVRRASVAVLVALVGCLGPGILAGTVRAAAAPAAATDTKVRCKYWDEIKAVSLPDAAGQPALIEITAHDFATYRDHLGLAADFGDELAGRRVLDVGAGLSDFIDVLADDYGADALAVDVSYGELDLSGLSDACIEAFHQRRFAMDATRLLFPSNFFDLVVSHSLLRWFFLAEPAQEEDARPRIRRGMAIVGQMIRVAAAGGEVRTTDFPDPYGAWYAQRYPDQVDEYRATYRMLLQPYGGDACRGDEPAGECALALSFHYDDEGRGYTVIRKLERMPESDARGTVSVIRAPRRPQSPRADR